MASSDVVSSVITFTGSAQQVTTPGAVREIHIQADPANGAVFYVGGSEVSAANGIVIPAPVSNIPSAPFILDGFNDGRVDATDLWVIGTVGEKARLLLLMCSVPF